MKNTERQQILDQEKYFKSQEWQSDLSGKMSYCEKCEFKNHPFPECTISHEERVEKSACAKAFNKQQKCKRLH